ncbi:MAG TPA: XTP/dITP diphosphatase [Polyangiaceae bacterium]|jgi:XTP/dITP diphosphohydrolase|nr:XTP/dITP diphosphatase [Polyangiaceae bacterium]
MSHAVMSIVVATSIRAKLAELRALLMKMPVDVLSAEEALGETPNVMEDGKTFEENALKKARAVAAASMMVTLADDSGLEVDALGGRPGVRSARFAGEGATDAENNAELLRRMADLDDPHRRARFRCAIALVDPWNPDGELVVDGSCEGTIAHQPTGTGGFGYDPLFIVSGLERTMAELNEDEKTRVSHRAKALAAIQPRLEAIIKSRLDDAMRVLR